MRLQVVYDTERRGWVVVGTTRGGGLESKALATLEAAYEELARIAREEERDGDQD